MDKRYSQRAADPEDSFARHLTFLYGRERVPTLLRRLQITLDQFQQRNPQFSRDRAQSAAEDGPTEQDVILITYGDQVTEPGKPPLQTLAEVLEAHVKGIISGLHILPFFPYSSDDGFSVIDCRTVNPELGTWADITRLGNNFGLMFDAVINHTSAQSRWFQEYLSGNPRYADYFITVDEGTDLSQVVRPRTLPLLTPVSTVHGQRLVWTTFSADQIDLNYQNPTVLLEIIEILLLYVERGGKYIRLDAIPYLWKKIGTSSIHLQETHQVVKLFRCILDAVAPHVILITEANVPHQQNISYFGDGSDEAQMVYQFTLPPLMLHTLHSGDASHLSEWISKLSLPADGTTFFNFLASHDGIGVRPVEGLLSPAEVQAMVERTVAHGGRVSHKAEADGSQTVYELNISYFDALSNPYSGESLDLQIQRFLVSQAILLSLAGMPGIYVHSLFGSRSYHAGVEQTGQCRSINREKFRRGPLEQELADPFSLRHTLFYRYLHLIRMRAGHRAFHPNAAQQVIAVHPSLFVVLRTPLDESESLLCVHNISPHEQPCRIDLGTLPFPDSGHTQDLFTGTLYTVDAPGTLTLRLAPYQALWLIGQSAPYEIDGR